jgi:hypothetical protein
VGEAAAEVVRGGLGRQAGEDLGFSGEAAKGAGVEDAGGIAGEGRAVGVGRLGVGAAGERAVAAPGDSNGQGKFGCRAGGGGSHVWVVAEATEEFTSGYTAEGYENAVRVQFGIVNHERWRLEVL